ncbi:InlB B-repeat-containing protein [Paenibacillus vini]|uniref:InlB B-repeat-containing protein n=1 Tax=Paenibacillus vini TaxID=1476024 RepID=UPI0025B68D54|nr:InlB B-repeat-containing protein [Paenibacillus vini]MDN4070629.1 InlB B-repeat-containing protein [Paenibacillus vini]
MLQRRQLFIPVLLFFVLFSWLSPQASAATIDFGTARVDVETNDVQDGYAPLKPVPLGDDLLLYWQDYTTTKDYLELIHPDGSFSSLPAPTISPRTNDQSDTIIYEGLSNGNILVYWYSGSSGTGLTDTYFKIINQNGTEVVGATKINSSPGSLNRFTKVAELSNGNLAFVWATDGSNYALRRFQPNGTPVDAAQLSVTSLAGISGSQYTHDIAAQKNGKFMIMISYYNPNYVGMIFNNDSPTPIQINGQNSFVISNRGENGNEVQWLKAMPDGRFLAIYRKKTGADTSSRSAVYQIFNSDGTVSRAETLIRNLNSWGGISEPILLPEGGYLLETSYLDYNTEPDTYHSYFEIYDDSGVYQGDVTASFPTLNDQYGTSILFLDVDGKLSLLINDKEPNRATYDVWLLRHSQAASYEVTFEDWDGTVLKTETVNRGEDATAPAAPSRTGYTFTGWDVGFTNVTSALTVKAQYKVNQYTVSFDSNEGSLVTEITADFGSKIVAPAEPTLEGFTFAGWYKNEALTQAWNFAIDTVPLNGITLYAKWNINVYQVTFEDWDGTVLKTETVNHGANATAPASPSRTGYTFTGWDKGFSNVTGALTVKAQYEANQYTVSFDSNGGSPVASVTADFDSLIVAPTEPTLEGFTFAGWYKDEALTQAWNFTTDTVPLDGITLYAKWNINVYQVTFEDWDGTVLKTEPVNHGADATAPAPPSRPGYTFTGWDKGFTNVTGALTVRAQYEANQYTVSFDSNGGSLVTAITADFGSKIVAPAVPTLEGFTFSGWYKDEALTQAWNFTTDTVPLDGITLYAKWNINVYQVTFEDWDGDVLKTEPVNHGANATAPASPSRPGYTFTGWDKGFTNVTGALTVKAQYDANQYTVSFDSNGGSLVTAITADFGSKIVAPAVPTLEGFTFADWYKDEALTQAWNFTTDTVPLDGITLYAKWNINVYQVTFEDWDGTVLKTEPVNHGADATAPAPPSRPGYTFTGWDKGFTNVTGALTVKAQYEANQYTVSFESNGGSLVTPITAEFDSLIVAPTEPTLEGYTFAGWYKDEALTQAWNFTTDTVPLDGITLYAKWTIQLPSVPSNLRVTTGDGQVTLNWDSASGATYYDVYMSTTPGLAGKTSIATVTEATYQVSELSNGTTYYFVVKAGNAGGLSTESNEVNATPQIPAPGAPVLQQAIGGNAKVQLSWSPVLGSTGYQIYQSTESGIYGSETATVTESVYSYEVDGLTNGKVYYFVVKAINEGGLSAESNEMSAKPATVPSAPRDVTAVAGNGQATITFTSPADNGGSSITKYEVTSSPGNIVATGVGSPIVITGLSNGTSYFFTVKAINEQGGSESSASSNTVTPFVSSGNNDPGSYSPPAQTTPSNPAVTTENKNVNILVNGKVENIGTQSLDVVNGQQVTTIQVDEAEFQKRLETAGNGAVITIPFDGESDIVIAELNGRMLKNMEDKKATVEVRTNGAVYTLPVQRIDIQSLAKQFGSNLEIQDIMLQVEIGIPSKESIQTAEKAASAQGLQMIVSPWNFSVKAVYGGRTLEVTKFDFFVERSIAIPNSVDPNKVTTGVVVDPDGSIRHVPTKVINQEGTYYAQINSLTNSMYSVVWHPVEFADVENHWAKDAVNDMGSRMVINGTGNGMFDPDRDITRAEFASIIVRSLGLKQENAPDSATFSDVFTSDWFNGAINTASAYQLINGFDDSSFRPNDKITREQAMEIISKAMKITGLETKGSTLDSDSTLRPFADSEGVSHWAMNGVTASVQAGIVSGRSVNELAPKSFITRAEVSMIVQRLLQKSDLI